MASKKLLKALNDAIALELTVVVQYMWQHVMAKGINAAAVEDVFEDTAIEEMKHAERIAERLFYFDVAPTTKPKPIKVGGSITSMLKVDAKAEADTIKFYKTVIALAAKEKDSTTRLLFEEILSDEEGHHDTFTTLLGQ